MNGRVCRGYTVASNILTNKSGKTESLDQTINRCQDSNKFLFSRNTFRSASYFWYPKIYDKEIESEIFYLTSDDKTVRVCPSNSIKTAGLHLKDEGVKHSVWEKVWAFFFGVYAVDS